MPPRRMEIDDAGSDDYMSDDDELYGDDSRRKGGKAAGKSSGKKRDKGKSKASEVNCTPLNYVVLRYLCFGQL